MAALADRIQTPADTAGIATALPAGTATSLESTAANTSAYIAPADAADVASLNVAGANAAGSKVAGAGVDAGAPSIEATSPFADPQVSASRVLRPAVDVVEDAHGVTLTMDLPGVQRQHLSVDVQGDRLSIDAALTLPAPAGLAAHHAEVRLARYHRAFTLARDLDPGAVDAKLEHGVLTLRIGKAAHAVPRKVDIRVS